MHGNVYGEIDSYAASFESNDEDGDGKGHTTNKGPKLAMARAAAGSKIGRNSAPPPPLPPSAPFKLQLDAIRAGSVCSTPPFRNGPNRGSDMEVNPPPRYLTL